VIRERAVILEAGGESLVAIVTEPKSPPQGARKGIVYLTRPRAHRNRMWVDAARAMAARGYTGIRFDYHGEGDSTGTPRYLDPEAPHAGDAVAAIRYLTDEAGIERVGILGSCFDGRTALSAVHDAPHYDALVFMSAPALDEMTERERLVGERDFAHYWRRVRQPGAWRALVSPERVGLALGIIGTRVARRAGALLGGARPDESAHSHSKPATAGNGSATTATAPAREGAPAPSTLYPSANFLRDLRALVARRTPALFLYGDADAYYPGFRLVMDRELTRLSPEERARLSFVVLQGEAHGYLSIPMQRDIVAHATDWLACTLSHSSNHEGSR
jgi:hypothetical protein